MRALRRSPLVRIAVLGLAVLFAHTVRANTQPIFAGRPPSPGKVTVAQPDPQKKPLLGSRQIVRPGRHSHARNRFGGSLDFACAQPASLLCAYSLATVNLERSTVSVTPQRRLFDLRI